MHGRKRKLFRAVQAIEQSIVTPAGSFSLLEGKNSQGISALSMRVNPDGTEDYSVSLQILAIMTAMGFIPAMVVLMTSFTRIVVVMAILRQALGLQQTPSNQVIIGIAIFMTFFVMSLLLIACTRGQLNPI